MHFAFYKFAGVAELADAIDFGHATTVTIEN